MSDFLKKEIAGRKLRLVMYKTAGPLKQIRTQVANTPEAAKIKEFFKNPAGGEGVRGGLAQAGKTGLFLGAPVAGAAVTDHYAGKHLEKYPALRAALDLAGASAVSPAMMRRAHSREFKNLAAEMSTRPDYIKARNEYFTNNKIQPRDRSMHSDDASAYAADAVKKRMNLEAITPAATSHAMGSAKTMAVPGLIGTGSTFMDGISRYLNEEMEVPETDRMGNIVVGADGKPVMVKKTRFEDISDSASATMKNTGETMKTVGSETSKTSKAIQGIAGGGGKDGQKGLADRLNTMAARADELIGGMAGGADAIKGFVERHPWVLKAGAGAAGAGVLAMLYKKLVSDPKKEEEKRKQKEREIRAQQRLARAAEAQVAAI